MGTNFYAGSQSVHIGKRSAAGLYCWDCGQTLCTVKELIHYDNTPWYDSCPKCGQRATEERLEKSSVGRELGFNSSTPQLKTGVKTCSSFSWGIDPEEMSIATHIKDEYGTDYTLEEFKQVLEECPIQYVDLIGIEFS